MGNADVTKASITTAFADLAAEAGISSGKFNVKGNELGSNFEIQFGGDFETGRRYATQFLLSLRLG